MRPERSACIVPTLPAAVLNGIANYARQQPRMRMQSGSYRVGLAAGTVTQRSPCVCARRKSARSHSGSDARVQNAKKISRSAQGVFRNRNPVDVSCVVLQRSSDVSDDETCGIPSTFLNLFCSFWALGF
jgi:hypothetical protein